MAASRTDIFSSSLMCACSSDVELQKVFNASTLACSSAIKEGRSRSAFLLKSAASPTPRTSLRRVVYWDFVAS